LFVASSKASANATDDGMVAMSGQYAKDETRLRRAPTNGDQRENDGQKNEGYAA
jgi:hypothetical protein